MIKKILFIIFLLAILLPVLGGIYFFFFTFSVNPGYEAIVTKSGGIVEGPKKPGLYSYNPITQEVHHIKWAVVRKWNQNLVKDKSYTYRIYWNINDTVSFFKKSQSLDINSELDSIFSSTKLHIENDVRSETVGHIAKMKSQDLEYQNSDLNDIEKMIQSKAKDFGIHIVRVDILSN